MAFQYFSETENGPTPRTVEEISPQAWGGIVATANAAVAAGAFGEEFPEVCVDGSDIFGTKEEDFVLAMQAEVPEMLWPLPTQDEDRAPFAPNTVVILDFVQFCYTHIAKPINGHYHSFFGHYHLSFDRESGRTAFREKVNRLLARNGAAFELQLDGNVIRLAPPVLAESLQSPLPKSGDSVLDGMVEESRRKFLSPDPRVRTESLERLWDAWERLKSLENPADKRRSIGVLLDKAASEAGMRNLIEAEARELTEIGNAFMIRHTEVNKTPIADIKHVDYLFHRMFAMITLLLKAR
jgi:AbiJ N-terminal domain 4